MRGAPFAVYSPARPGGRHSPPYKMLSWGHWVQGVYRAAARSPGNAFVQSTLLRGVTGMTLFRNTTPADVLRWIIDLSNKFHHGSGKSFVEVIHDTCAAEAKWQLHREKRKITARSGSGDTAYATLYKRFIQTNFPALAKSWQSYENRKALVSSLNRHGWLKDFSNEFYRSVNFMHPRLNVDVVLSMCYHLQLDILTFFEPTITLPGLLKALVFEAFLFCAPN